MYICMYCMCISISNSLILMTMDKDTNMNSSGRDISLNAGKHREISLSV